MSTPRLSIVVPFFNVENFVVPCLESLRRQTFRDFEVVLVDDGSEDGTLALVEQFSEADRRFRVVRQENQGLGPARNTGVAHAQGEFLAFIDSDDLVPRRAFAQLVGSLDRTGSDFAAGNARRFNTLGVRSSSAHRVPFEETRTGTSVREVPELALDRMAWNKVYRRAFWDEHALEFPAMLYEDYPVSIKAHILARSVDALEQPVCYWRERDGGEPSITQRAWRLENLQDRIDSALKVLDALEKEQLTQAYNLVAQHLLNIDVAAVIGALHQNHEAEHPAIMALAQRLLARIPAEVRATTTRFDAVQAVLIEEGRLAELVQLETYRAERGTSARVVTRGRLRPQRYAELPFFGQDHIVPRQTYRLSEDSRIRPVVSDAFWRGGTLNLILDLGLAPIPVGDRSKIRVWLETRDGRRLDLPVERFKSQVAHVGTDVTGVHVRVDPLALPDWDRPGFWVIHVGVRSSRLRVSRPVQGVANSRARFVPPEWADADVVVQPCRRSGVFGLWIRRPRVVVENAVALYDTIELSGWLDADQLADETALVVGMPDRSERSVPVEIDPEQPEGWQSTRHRWSARIPVAPLIDHGPDFDPVEEPERLAITVDVDGRRRRAVVGQKFTGAAVSQTWRSITATRSPLGQLVLLESHVSPRLVDLKWEKGRLAVQGVWDGPGPMPDEVVLRNYPRPMLEVERRLPLETEEGCFSFVVEVGDLIDALSEVEELPDQRFWAKPWNLLFAFGNALVNPVISRDLPSAMPEQRRIRGHDASLYLDRGDVARLLVVQR